ncbi:hypothetical protein TNCV_3370781 [Trichonephila clavipes]|nr:hypothetical protein TNCV_3370781 [Trichonephila clavipes]
MTWYGVIVIVTGPWNGIGYCSRVNLFSVCGGMTAIDGYGGDPENSTNQIISLSVKPVVHRHHGAPNMVFQKDNARPHIAQRTLNSLTGFKILPSLANSPDLNPIEHLRDIIGYNMNQRPPAQTIDDLRTAVNVAWQWLPQAIINGLIDRCLFGFRSE